MTRGGKVASLLVLHGPNLQALGEREPERYGKLSLSLINQRLQAIAQSQDVRLSFYQSNLEGELINALYTAKADGVDFIVVNPAAYGHTSIALRDAFLSVAIPFIEVHLSNIYARETFRHRSYLADIAEGVIIGLGVQSYELAVQAACDKLRTTD